ncbi:MAG TPA: alpha-xylosidase, partial [Lachnospiraceae bacterium]|nr:alpha-xylosidase [Lachnospiraceae bacterium]
VDFTNPAACEWYAGKLEKLLDMGVDCFKTDFGERIPTDCVYYDGSDPVKMHNYYTYLYNKTVYDLIARKKGKEEAVLFARSATVGGQKFPVHWGGDCWSDYESMEESLRGGLSLTMSGFGYWSHDIGGFENTSTPDVYKRWCAFGLLSSHSRLHGSTSYRVPWAYDEEAVDVVRYFTKLKARLMPYLYRNAIETSKTGVPMMRSMVLEFTQDKNCAHLDKQYMFGDSLLVAPIFNEESIAEYYLPEGKWTNFLTGEEREGGKWYSEKHGYLSIPLYAREGSIIALGASDNGPVYDYAKDVNYQVFHLSSISEKTCAVYNTNNQIESELFIQKEDNTYKLKVTGTKPCKITLVNVADVTVVQGGTSTIENGSFVIVPENNEEVVVKLA